MAAPAARPRPYARDFSVPKLVNDPVHGHLEFEGDLFRLIDTPQFQRLRDLHQLGSAHLVFPGGSHKRFEHCLGVAHLAGQMIQNIRRQQPELNITEHDVLLVKVAGLCHDLGHGPFSHMFEEFLKVIYAQRGEKLRWKHEYGSCTMLQSIYDDNLHDVQSVLSQDDIQFIKQLITNDLETYPTKYKRPRFMYDIVANQRNGVDVDKLDYLLRDCYNIGIGRSTFSHERLIKSARAINGRICYSDKENSNIYDMFATRYKLHKLCYNHKVSKAIEYMIRDILVMADPHLHIADAIQEPCKYLNMTDSILRTIESSVSDNLLPARQLIHRLRLRDLYRCAHSILIPADFLQHITARKDALQPHHILRHDSTKLLTSDDIEVQLLKLNYAKGDIDPVQHVYFYKKTNLNHAFSMPASQTSLMIPKHMQEVFVRVFVKEPTPSKLEAAKNALVTWAGGKGMSAYSQIPAPEPDKSPPPMERQTSSDCDETDDEMVDDRKASTPTVDEDANTQEIVTFDADGEVDGSGAQSHTSSDTSLPPSQQSAVSAEHTAQVRPGQQSNKVLRSKSSPDRLTRNGKRKSKSLANAGNRSANASTESSDDLEGSAAIHRSASVGIAAWKTLPRELLDSGGDGARSSASPFSPLPMRKRQRGAPTSGSTLYPPTVSPTNGSTATKGNNASLPPQHHRQILSPKPQQHQSISRLNGVNGTAAATSGTADRPHGSDPARQHLHQQLHAMRENFLSEIHKLDAMLDQLT